MKQWIDTMILLIQNVVKITKKFISIIEKYENLTPQSQEISLLKLILMKIKSVIMVSKGDLIPESIKTLHEIITAKPEVLRLALDSIFDSLAVVKSFLVEVRQDSKELKLIMTKFIPEVLEILTELYEPERFAILNPKGLPYAKNLFEIVDKVKFNAHILIF